MKTNKEQQIIKFGLFTFYASIDENIFKNQQIVQQLKISQFSIGKKQYQKCRWAQILKHIIQYTGRQMWFFKCESPTILKEISHINFKNLIQLSLAYNRIDNIQAISFLDCKNLTGLYIHNNNINRIQSLIKWSCSQCYTLLLSNNFINQIQSLNKCALLYISQLSLQNRINQTFQCKDLSKLFKMPALIKTLNINIGSNIFQKNELVQMLRQTFQIQKLSQ